MLVYGSQMGSTSFVIFYSAGKRNFENKSILNVRNSAIIYKKLEKVIETCLSVFPVFPMTHVKSIHIFSKRKIHTNFY